MRAIRSVALLSGVALLATVPIAPPAAADRYAESDPARDMAVSMPDEDSPLAAPTHHKLDIRHVVVRHTNQVVSIHVQVRHLTRPRGDEEFGLHGVVQVDRAARPSEGETWTWQVWGFDKRHPREAWRALVLDSAYFEQPGCSYTDKGLRARADYDRLRITVVIPRHCLALAGAKVQPRWVKVSVSTWHSRGLDRPSYSDRLGSQRHFTPRLYPGLRAGRVQKPATCA